MPFLGFLCSAAAGGLSEPVHPYKKLSQEEQKVRKAAEEMKIAWAGSDDPAPPPKPLRICESTAICPDDKCLLSPSNPRCSYCCTNGITTCSYQTSMLSHPDLKMAHEQNDITMWNSNLKTIPPCHFIEIEMDGNTIEWAIQNKDRLSYNHFKLRVQAFRFSTQRILNDYPATLKQHESDLAAYEEQLKAVNKWVPIAKQRIVHLTRDLHAALSDLIPDTCDPTIKARLVNKYCTSNTLPGIIDAQLDYYSQAVYFVTSENTGELKYTPPANDYIASLVTLVPYASRLPPYCGTSSIHTLTTRITATKAAIAYINSKMSWATTQLAAFKVAFPDF